MIRRCNPSNREFVFLGKRNISRGTLFAGYTGYAAAGVPE